MDNKDVKYLFRSLGSNNTSDTIDRTDDNITTDVEEEVSASKPRVNKCEYVRQWLKNIAEAEPPSDILPEEVLQRDLRSEESAHEIRKDTIAQTEDNITTDTEDELFACTPKVNKCGYVRNWLKNIKEAEPPSDMLPEEVLERELRREESASEIRKVIDRICKSSHLLNSDQEILKVTSRKSLLKVSHSTGWINGKKSHKICKSTYSLESELITSHSEVTVDKQILKERRRKQCLRVSHSTGWITLKKSYKLSKEPYVKSNQTFRRLLSKSQTQLHSNVAKSDDCRSYSTYNDSTSSIQQKLPTSHFQEQISDTSKLITNAELAMCTFDISSLIVKRSIHAPYTNRKTTQTNSLEPKIESSLQAENTIEADPSEYKSLIPGSSGLGSNTKKVYDDVDEFSIETNCSSFASAQSDSSSILSQYSGETFTLIVEKPPHCEFRRIRRLRRKRSRPFKPYPR